MADIFLSYKKEDRARAEAIVEALRKSGKSVWWDDGLTPHEAWDATIEREIAEAANVVVLWSSRSVASNWVRTEAHYAQDRNKLIPVLIEPCTIPLAFMLKQAVDLAGWHGSLGDPAWRKLLEWLDEDRPATTPRPPPAAPRARRFERFSRRPVALALAALLVVAAAVTGWLVYRSRGVQGSAPSVRVAALSVPAGDAAATVFAQGFAADLAQIVTTGGSKLQVIDGAAAGAPAGKTDFMLTGNVRSGTDKLRAALTLNAAEDGAIIWSTSLERPLGEADAMHQQAEVKMASVFICALDENARDRSIVPLDALKVYLQACEALPNGDGSSARKLLRDVTRLAPNFAQGWATLAEWAAFSEQYDEVGDPDVAKADRKEALDAAARALTLDPRNATAWTARSMTKLTMGEWQAAQADLDKGFSLNPDEPIGNYFYASHLRNVGRLGEALEHAQRGANSGPRFWPKTLQVISLMADNGDADGAMKMLADARKTWPDNDNLKRLALDIATKYLDPKRAAAVVADPALADAAVPARFRLYGLELAARVTPSPAPIETAATAINALFHGPEDAVTRAAHLITIGRIDEAYAALQQPPAPLYNAPYIPNPSWFFAANAAKFSADPRFMTFARRQGLVAIWQATNKWPDFCTATDAPYDCKAVARGLK